jgi:hypothetical protein
LEKQLLGLILVVFVVWLLVDEFHPQGEKHLSRTLDNIFQGVFA